MNDQFYIINVNGHILHMAGSWVENGIGSGFLFGVSLLQLLSFVQGREEASPERGKEKSWHGKES